VQIDDSVLKKLEKLSMLEIDENKREKIKSELEGIVNFVENLNELDVSHIDATFTTLEGGTPLRDDAVVDNRALADSVLGNAPLSEGRYFKVPKIIE
jgi:aspartyl-tRNA(Asn)/glutamyl-tRNA(Gln) amidotransferase subunit C